MDQRASVKLFPGLALAAAAAAAMLIHLEKDPILTWLWAKPQGLVWTGGFIYRLGLYGAVPLVTLFAWQFPRSGGCCYVDGARSVRQLDRRPALVTRHGSSNSASRPYAVGSEQARGHWFDRAAESVRC
jgi:hypothetical protein